MNKIVNREMTIFTPYMSLGLADKKFIVANTLVWCEENLPIHHCGFPPDYKFRSTPLGFWAGYDPDRHSITISTTEIRDVRHLISSVLHEWCHSVQDLSSYDVLLAEKDIEYYQHHPLEKEARRYEVLWYMVWPEIKSKLGTSPTRSESWALWLNMFYREILGF